MPDVELRALAETDRDRVAEISSQIWDGHDYVPELFDVWLGEGEAVAAVLDGQVIAFAHRTWIHPRCAWFEGIRTDPVFRGRGAGRAITEHLIAQAVDDGAQRITLSTHADNVASIHIIESYGFERVVSFAYLEKEAAGDPVDRNDAGGIVDISEEEAIGFVDRSNFLEIARRWYPGGWRFFPFDLDPQAAIARMETRLGIHRSGELAALLCIRQSERSSGPATLNFVDGEPDDIRRLLRIAHHRYAGRRIKTMVPKQGELEPALLPVLREFEYESWDDCAAHVFVYERLL